MSSRVVWDPDRSPEESWLATDDVRADALKSLKTEGNSLSIYVVQSEDDLPRLLAGFCANKDKIQAIDYVLIDEQVLTDLGIAIDAIAGDLPDSVACAWHRDLIHLTGKKIVELACALQLQGIFCRVLDKRVAQLINDSIATQFIDTALLKSSIVQDLQKPKYCAPAQPTDATPTR